MKTDLNSIPSRFWPAAACALYGLIFLLPLPPRFESHGVEITDELLLAAGCIVIYAAFTRQGWVWKALGLSATLMVCTLPLLRVWETAASSVNQLLGLLPFLDANGYYNDALRLIAGRLFLYEGVYRPLFSSFLALVLMLANGNLQTAMVVCAVIYGLGVFALASEVRRAFGALAGIMLIVLLQFFYRQFAGAPMTEQMGLPMGAFALAALIQSLRTDNPWLYPAGLFLLSFALEARAGAYFVLPALVIFGSLRFARTRKSLFSHALLLVLAIALAWAGTAGVRRMVTPPGTMASPNFAFTLYGQATPGGVGWIDFAIDHPEVMHMPRDRQGQIAYQYVLEEIRKNPFGLVQSSLISLAKFWSPTYLFDMIEMRNQGVNLVLQIGCLGLLLAGLGSAWSKRADPMHGLLLAGFAGAILSAPFLPPWDGGDWWGGIRVHAATLGFHLTLSGIGLSGLIHRLRPAGSAREAEPVPAGGNLFWALGFVLAATVWIGPPLLLSTAGTIPATLHTCAADEARVLVLLPPGAYLRIEGNDFGRETRVPVVLVKDVQRSLRGLDTLDFNFDPRSIEPGSVFSATLDQLTGERTWVVGPGGMAGREDVAVSACGHIVRVGYNVILVNAYQFVPIQ